jgi:hypothetical protein
VGRKSNMQPRIANIHLYFSWTNANLRWSDIWDHVRVLPWLGTSKISLWPFRVYQSPTFQLNNKHRTEKNCIWYIGGHKNNEPISMIHKKIINSFLSGPKLSLGKPNESSCRLCCCST